MAKIIRYNPWNEMANLNRFMGRWMDETMTNGRSPRDWNFDAPAVDVKETPEAYEIKAALPGWKADDVDVTIDKGVVTLKGEVKQESDDKPENGPAKWHSREIRRSSFVRSFTLPVEVQTDKAEAQFDNGVLTLNLPKAEVVKPKQIKIGINNGSKQTA